MTGISRTSNFLPSTSNSFVFINQQITMNSFKANTCIIQEQLIHTTNKVTGFYMQRRIQTQNDSGQPLWTPKKMSKKIYKKGNFLFYTFSKLSSELSCVRLFIFYKTIQHQEK